MRRLSVLFFLLLFGDKNVACKSSPDLYFYPLIIKSFWFAKLQLKISEKIHTKANADVSRDPGERVFLGGLEGGVGRKLRSLVKLYERFWIWNFDQNLIMAVSTVLKPFNGFEEKEPTRQEISEVNFSFKMFKMRLLRSWK